MKNKKSLADLRYLLAVLNPFFRLIRAREEILGLTFLTYKADVVGRAIFKTKTYDPFISRWLVDRFKGKNGVFIDVGANLGYFTCLLGTLAKDSGVVIAVEPEPENLDLLRANVRENGLEQVVKIFPVALGEFEGSANLNVYKKSNRGRHSLVGTDSTHSLSVPIKTLDQLVESVLSPESIIDFMKIDVEGYEPFVVRGAQSVLGRVECMLMEYAPYLLEKSGFNLHDFIENLEATFPSMYIVREENLVATSCDAILIQKEPIDILFMKSPAVRLSNLGN